MRGISDTEDGTQPGATKWMQSAPRRHRAHAHARTTRETELSTDLVTPVFQPLRGGTGRRWEAIEYGIATDNSSLISADSAAEREDTDQEIMSFNLGPEPFDQLVQDRLPSDEYLDDLQQGLIPGGSEPRTMMEYEPTTDARQSLSKTIRQDMEAAIDAQEDTPMSPERAPEPSIGFSYYYQTDSPPTIQRIAAHIKKLLNYARTLFRPCVPRDRVPDRSHRFQQQWRRWPSGTCLRQMTSPHRYRQLAQRHDQLPPLLSNALGEGEVVAGGARSPERHQVWVPGVRQGRQRHRLCAPCGQRSQTSRS